MEGVLSNQFAHFQRETAGWSGFHMQATIAGKDRSIVGISTIEMIVLF